MSFGSFARASSTSSGLGSFWDSTAKIDDFSKARVSGTRVARGTSTVSSTSFPAAAAGAADEEREGRREGGRGEAGEGTSHHAT